MTDRHNVTAHPPWHLAWRVADMPKKTGDYLMITDMGWTITFYWDARERRCFLYSPRHHLENGEDVDDGKIDSFRVRLGRSFPFAWMEIPEFGIDSDESGGAK